MVVRGKYIYYVNGKICTLINHLFININVDNLYIVTFLFDY